MCQNSLPPIDVIIVNYNGMHFLPACLNSLFASDYPDFSVIVVDNASSDGSVGWIKDNYPDVMLIENQVNEGFGRANTAGILRGTAEFVVFLNSDTRVAKNWLCPLVAVMLKYENCGAVCSKLVFMDHPELINAAGGGMNFVGFGYDIDMFSLTDGASVQTKNVLFPTAAACMVRRSAFKDVGGFDSQFFMYHEDVDLGWRLNLMGYFVKYVPQSLVWHAFGGTSLKTGSMRFRNRLGLRHALRSLIKNYELGTLFKVLPVFSSLCIKNFLSGIPTGFFAALLWNLLKLPSTILERSRVQRYRKVSDCRLSHLIWQDIHLPVQFPDYKLKTFNEYVLNPGDKFVIDLISPHSFNLGYGWHCKELFFKDMTTYFRWSRQAAVFYFWYSGGESVINIEILGLASVVGRKRKFSVQIQGLSGQGFMSLPGCEIQSDVWEHFRIPYQGIPGPVSVKITVHDPWIPHEKFMNMDYRLLGIGVKGASVLYDQKG